MHVVNRIRTTELEEALLTLPFSKMEHLFTNILCWLNNKWNTDLALKTLYYLLSVHHKQIVATGGLKTILIEIQDITKRVVEEGCSIVGYNYSALAYLKREILERNVVGFGESEPKIGEAKNSKGGEKRKRVVIK